MPHLRGGRWRCGQGLEIGSFPAAASLPQAFPQRGLRLPGSARAACHPRLFLSPCLPHPRAAPSRVPLAVSSVPSTGQRAGGLSPSGLARASPPQRGLPRAPVGNGPAPAVRHVAVVFPRALSLPCVRRAHSFDCPPAREKASCRQGLWSVLFTLRPQCQGQCPCL